MSADVPHISPSPLGGTIGLGGGHIPGGGGGGGPIGIGPG